MRNTRCGFLLFLAAVFSGCQRDNPKTTHHLSISELGDRIAHLPLAERYELTKLTADPLPDLAPVGQRNDQPSSSLAKSIAKDLHRLTLSEADTLGQYLDKTYNGTGSIFAKVPALRQQKALNKIREIQARLTSDQNAWIQDPVTTLDLDLPWLRQQLGTDVNEVVRVSFAREYYDLGTHHSDVSDFEMRYVAALPGLRRLDLQHSDVGSVGLKQLSVLRLLEDLDLSETKITNTALRHLTGLPQLTNLRLNGTNIDGSSLTFLSNCPHLQQLSLTRIRLSTEGMTAVNGLKHLRVLWIGQADELNLSDLPWLHEVYGSVGETPDDRVAVQLVRLPRLKIVALNIRGRIRKFEMNDLPNLRRFQISCSRLDKSQFEQIGRQSSLQTLMVGGLRTDKAISAEEFQQLSGLSELKNLHIAGPLSAEALQVFEKLTALRELFIVGDDISDDSLTHLRRLTELEDLTLAGVHGSGLGFAVLQEMPKLRFLRINGSKLEHLHLQGHPRLEDISGNLNHIHRLHIADMPRLRRLDLDRLQTTSVEIGKLPAIGWVRLSLVQADQLDGFAVKDMPMLETLHVIPITWEGSIENIPHIANIGDDFLRAVAALKNLRSLELPGSAITNAGLELLYGMPSLRTVFPSGPQVTIEATRDLRKALKRTSR
jgi:Leucine-rich repeat (LRR) protein